MTPPAVTGDCISQNTWYFYSTTADQGGVWYFWGRGDEPEPGCLGRQKQATEWAYQDGRHCTVWNKSL